jgi:hypothetical protein
VSAAAVKPGLDVLLLDREQPRAARYLERWLDRETARRTLAESGERFLLIATLNTHREPRFLHVIEYLRDARALLGRVGVHLDAVERWVPVASPAPIDFKTVLAPEDDARFNQLLDAREVEQLRRATVGGRA